MYCTYNKEKHRSFTSCY